MLVNVRILVVEDEAHLARVLKRGLTEEGINVEVVADGLDGLHRATEEAYDAIVLDIMLPGMNGYQVCSQLRNNGIWTPVLILTALSEALDHAEALDLGADDFLVKPFSFVVLVAHLRALTRRAARERPVVLTAGDLRLDPAQHRCWRGETEIPLSARQFSLMEFLMRRAGEVVPKTDLLEQIWDLNYAGDVNIVEVYVRKLRQKLDIPFGRNSIQTIRLVGYRLDPAG
jgi:DNA-binding response OmpR family regulator